MSDIQIVGRLTKAERALFGAYARSVGLDVAGLLAVLWARELRVGRLCTLLLSHPEPTLVLDDKVVARVHSQSHKQQIVTHAIKHGMSMSRACATLVRAELSERWLERAM